MMSATLHCPVSTVQVLLKATGMQRNGQRIDDFRKGRRFLKKFDFMHEKWSLLDRNFHKNALCNLLTVNILK